MDQLTEVQVDLGIHLSRSYCPDHVPAWHLETERLKGVLNQELVERAGMRKFPAAILQRNGFLVENFGQVEEYSVDSSDEASLAASLQGRK